MNIFAGTELPRWMQDVRKENGILGETAGTVIAGGLLALQQDPDKTNDDGTHPLKGLQQGLAEARMNEQDPNWLVKHKGLESQVVSNWARAATQWQAYNATANDMKQWATEDLPALSKYQEELKTNPNAVPPVMKSDKGQQALQGMQMNQLKRQALDYKQQQLEDLADYRDKMLEQKSVSAQQDLDEFKSLNKMIPTIKDPVLRTQARDLLKKGDVAGAWKIADPAEKEAPASVQAAKIRAEGRLKEIDAQEKSRRSLEADRQKNRIEVKLMDITGKKDIERMKQDARNGVAGPHGESPEDYFVNRHWNTVMTAEQNANKYLEKPKSVDEMEFDTDVSLRSLYRASRPKTTPGAAATKPTTPTAATTPIGTNAPPKKVLKWNPDTQQLE